MGRRSGAGREPAKTRGRKTVTRKRRNAPKAVHRRSSSAGLDKKVALLARERDEALEQQAAITDILRVIADSPSDVQPVLDSVARHAARICEAQIVEIVSSITRCSGLPRRSARPSGRRGKNRCRWTAPR